MIYLLTFRWGGVFNRVKYALINTNSGFTPSVFISKINNNHEFIGKYLDYNFKEIEIVIVVDKNGVVGVDCDFTTIKEAIDYANNSNQVVQIKVKPALYDIIAEFGDAYMNAISEADDNYRGLILDNIKIIGQGYGVKLTANYQGNNDYAKAKFSIFNIAGNFQIENIELESTNVRYCVHEDNPLTRKDYVGLYKNVKMTHYGTNGVSYTSVTCIGGGTTGNSTTTIDTCEFNNAWETEINPVSYHNNPNNAELAQVIVKNSYFHSSQTFQTWVYQANGSKIKCYLCNNKFGASPNYLGGVGGKVQSIEFGNVIKVTED